MSAKYCVWLNSSSVPSIDARPAGFQNVASAPETSLVPAIPNAEVRGPTGINSSGAPPVPFRSSEPAHAEAAARVRPTARASARFMSRSMVRPPSLLACLRIAAASSEVVQAFFFHEHHDPSTDGAL